MKKKTFFRCIGDKRNPRVEVGLFWKEGRKERRYMVTQDIKKAEVLSGFFAKLFKCFRHAM